MIEVYSNMEKEMIEKKYGRLTIVSRGEDYIIPSTGQKQEDGIVFVIAVSI